MERNVYVSIGTKTRRTWQRILKKINYCMGGLEKSHSGLFSFLSSWSVMTCMRFKVNCPKNITATWSLKHTVVFSSKADTLRIIYYRNYLKRIRQLHFTLHKWLQECGKDLSVIICNNYRWSELNSKATPRFGGLIIKSTWHALCSQEP